MVAPHLHVHQCLTTTFLNIRTPHCQFMSEGVCYHTTYTFTTYTNISLLSTLYNVLQCIAFITRDVHLRRTSIRSSRPLSPCTEGALCSYNRSLCCVSLCPVLLSCGMKMVTIDTVLYSIQHWVKLIIGIA